MHILRSTIASDDEPRSDLDDASQPALFLTFQRDGLVAGPARYLLGDVQEVIVGRGPSRTAELEDSGGKRRLGVTLCDPRISSEHFSIRRTGGGWELADAGARNGTSVNSRRVERTLLADGDLIEAGRTFFLFRRTVAGCAGRPTAVDAADLDLSRPGFATVLPQLEMEFARLCGIAGGNLSIALQGESGTGKELLAAAVHRLSGRSGPFLALNCDGRFRRDLYERLAGYVATLPPLRERIEDLGLIATALLRKLEPHRAEAIHLTAEAARALLAYDWPGNVRELENCLRAALIFSGTDPIDLSHLAAGPRRAVETGLREAPVKAAELSEAQLKRRQELEELLTANGGNVSAVARVLGKDRVQIQRWLRRFELDPRAFRR